MNTMVDVVRKWADCKPDAVGVTFLADGELDESRLTYRELDRRARALAVALLREAAPGDRALLLHPSGLEFVVAFFGCLYAGIVAIPAYPPRNARHMARIETILEDAEARLILTTAQAKAKIEPWLGERAGRFLLVCTEDVTEEGAELWTPGAARADKLAFLQYTSGSTGTPKGVMVGHGNVMANERMLQSTMRTHGDSTFISWLPVYHDMGLISNLLHPLYLGSMGVLMPPVSFLQKPARWLAAVTRFGGRVTGGPNFAFDLCARGIPEAELASLDLRTLDRLYNGSEPIHGDVLERFTRKFAPCGFDADQYMPCYGMAETTLISTGSHRPSTPTVYEVDSAALEQGTAQAVNGNKGKGRALIGCGRSVAGQRLVIADPEARTALADGRVGEIWISGPHVCQGYWRKPEATAEIFGARLADGDGPFLRTGDLGFVRDGELFVTGRIKDLIIIRGRNHYPHDIEKTVERSHPALQPGSGAAFSITEAGEERLVVAHEVQRSALRDLDVEAVQSAVRRAIAEEHEIAVHAIVLLKPVALPKTSSGKIRRRSCRTAFQDGTLETVAVWSQPAGAPVDTGSRDRADAVIGWLRHYAEHRIDSWLIDERRSIPPYIVLDFGNQGLLGLQVPVADGGLGLRTGDTLRVIEQLAAIDSTLTSFVGVHNALGLWPLLGFGSAAQREKVLRRLAEGRELVSFAYTEPVAGSNPRAIAAAAHADGQGGWRIGGAKQWIGSAAWAGYLHVFAQTFDERGEPLGITAFLIEQGRPGLRMGAEELTLGMRGMVQNAVHLDGVAAVPGDVVGSVGGGMTVAQEAMQHARLFIAAASLGALKRAAALMLRYAGRRSINTGLLLNNLTTRDRLTEVTRRIALLERLIANVAGAVDAGTAVPDEVYAVLKVAGPESAWQGVDFLMQMLGGRGYIETNEAARHFRDIRLLRIFEGPSETMVYYVGSRLAQESPELFRFLARFEGEGGPVAAALQNAARDLKRRFMESADDPARIGDRMQRVSLLLGDLGVAGIWLALAGGADDRALALLRARFAELQAAVALAAPEQEPLTAAELAREIAGYRDRIGDIESQAPGENHRGDPLLRRDAEGSAPQASPAAPARPAQAAPAPAPAPAKNRNREIEEWLRQWIGARIGVTAERIDPAKSFFDFGLDSVTAVDLTVQLGAWVKRPLSPTLFWDFPTIEELARHVGGASAAPSVPPATAPLPSPVDGLSEKELAKLLSDELKELRAIR